MAETPDKAYLAFDQFVSTYSAKYPKAPDACRRIALRCWRFTTSRPITGHLRPTNLIESTFATIRHRTNQVKGAFSLSQQTLMAMMFKLAIAAEQ